MHGSSNTHFKHLKDFAEAEGNEGIKNFIKKYRF
jgi:hypothetical protein